MDRDLKSEWKALTELARSLGGFAWQCDLLSLAPDRGMKLSGSVKSTLGVSKDRAAAPFHASIMADGKLTGKLRAEAISDPVILEHSFKGKKPLLSVVIVQGPPDFGLVRGFTVLKEGSRKFTNRFVVKLLLDASLQGPERWSLIKLFQKNIFEYFDAAFTNIWTIDPDSKRLKQEVSSCLARLGFKSMLSDAEIAKGKELPGKTWKLMKPVCEQGLSKRTRLTRHKLFRERGIESALYLPLFISDHFFVVVEVLDVEESSFDSVPLKELEELCETVESLIGLWPVELREFQLSSKMKELLDRLPMMVWLKDREGKILACNKETEIKMRSSAELLIGRNTRDVHREAGERYRKGDWKILQSAEPKYGFIERFDTADGDFWVKVDKVPLFDSEKDPYGIAVFCSDHVEVKGIVEAKSKIQSQFKNEFIEQSNALAEANIFFDLSKEFFCIADNNGYFTRINPGWSQLLGYSVDELLSRPYIDFVHPDDRQSTIGVAKELLETGQLKGFENRYITKSGDFKWLRWSCTSYDDVIYGTAYDVTDKKIAEQNLASLSNRFAQLATLVPGMIYQFHYALDGTMSFPYVSGGAKKLFGYEPHEIESDASLIFGTLHEEDLPVVMHLIEESVKNFTQFQCETRVLNAGKVIHVRASSTPQRLEDGSLMYSGLITDISDLKEAQEVNEKLTRDLAGRLESLKSANEELEKLTVELESAYDKALEGSKLKSEFVANISHEVRTPVSAVIGLSELLLDTNLDTEQHEHVSNIIKSARTLLTIINDILDFSKIEAGKLSVESIDYDLVSMVEGSVALFAHEASHKDLRLSVHIDPRLPLLVKGDPVRCRQILLNLTSNAIKFTAKGEITVRVYPLENEKEELVFEVADQGIGISSEHKEKLFTPFVQADGTTTRDYGGTGLGLSICKRLTELMGGSIGFDSKEGEGTTFRFSYPCKLELSDPKSREESFTVFLYQGHQSEIEIVKSYLDFEGISVDTVTGYGELVYKLDQVGSFSENQVTVIISLTDERNSNTDVVSRLRQGNRYRDVNIICLYDYRTRSSSRRALELGASNSLMIPIRQYELINLVHGRKLYLEDNAPKMRKFNESNILSPNVLVVEDTRLMRMLAKRQLENLNVNVELCRNGHEALEIVKKKDFDLIFMDCQMPEMDGFEATHRIRKWESDSGKHTPIIAMTAFAMDGDREHCMASGMDDYLKKPVSIKDLQSMIVKWLPSKNGEDKGEMPQVKESFDYSDEFDLNLLKEHYGDDVVEILSSFYDEINHFRPRLKASIEEGDMKQLARDAHTLKGLVSVLCIQNLEAVVNQLVVDARGTRKNACRETFTLLDERITSLVKYIKSFLEVQNS